MGLLRRRPKIDRHDTPFQALARLSLANDNDLLLERIICTIPRSSGQPWYSFKDGYGVKLWDINPNCQISGICEDDTVLLDGAFGATIHWDRFRKVTNARRAGSWKRLGCQIALHGAPYFFILGVLLLWMAIDAKRLLIRVDGNFAMINTAYSDFNGTFNNISMQLKSVVADIGVGQNTQIKRHVLFERVLDATKAVASIEAKVSSIAGEIPSQVSAMVSQVTAEAGVFKSEVSAKFDSIESVASVRASSMESVAGVKASFAMSAVLPIITSFEANMASKVSGFADQIQSAVPRMPSGISKDEAAVASAQQWAVFLQLVGILLIIVASIAFLLAPYLTRMLYRGKFCKLSCSIAKIDSVS